MCDPDCNCAEHAWDAGECCMATCPGCLPGAGMECADPAVCAQFPEECSGGPCNGEPCIDGWAGDGLCDSACNCADYSFDEGDCCETTCIGTCPEFLCTDPAVCEPQPELCADDGGCSPDCSPDWPGDGYCDDVCNCEIEVWDGGDCCESTCEPGAGGECPPEIMTCLDPAGQ